MSIYSVLGVALATVLVACGPDAEDLKASNGESEALFTLEVLAAVPSARLLEDVPAGRAQEERAYTEDWLKVALRPSALAQVDVDQFRFVSDLAPRGDDAVVGSVRIDGHSIEVVDGRELLFEVHASTTAESMQSLWWQLFGREGDSVPRSTNVLVHETGAVPGGGAYGTICHAEPPPRWFVSPPRWYRLGDRTAFAFEKRLAAPRHGGTRPERGWIPEGTASKYIGGIPPSDLRRYLRFEPTNRVALAQARARDLNGPGEPREGPAYGASGGSDPK